MKMITSAASASETASTARRGRRQIRPIAPATNQRSAGGKSFEERLNLWQLVHREALLARFRGIRVLELARELYRIAVEGLRRQAAVDEEGRDERVYLDRLGEQLAMGRSPARVIAEKWKAEWLLERRIERLIEYAEYRA